MCYLEVKGYFKNESYEDTKISKANVILQGAHYDGNSNFTLEDYYNLVAESFVLLEEAGPV